MSESPEAPEELPENIGTKDSSKRVKISKKKRACFHIFGRQLCRISSNALGQALAGQIQSY